MALEAAQVAGLAVARIRFRHQLVNDGNSPLNHCVGLWSIIQIPADAGGTVLLGLRDTVPSNLDGVRACYTPIPPEVIRRYGHAVLLRTGGGNRYKVGVPAAFSAGTVASVRRVAEPDIAGRCWVFTAKKFAIGPTFAYADTPLLPSGKAEIASGHAAQAYNDSGLGTMAFCEIESHAPAPALAPGQSQTADIEILLATGEGRPLRRLMGEELALDCPPDVFNA